MNKKKDPPVTVEGLLQWLGGVEYFTGMEEVPPALTMKHVPGTAPLAVVVGPNASGKSLFRRLVAAACAAREPRVEFMGVSMELRTDGGIGRSFVFGSEGYDSTGRNSVSSVLGGIRTCRARTSPHVIFFDEPDVGLSDGYARGVGRALAELAANPPEHTRAIFVVSHRKVLIRELLPVAPHGVFMGYGEAPPASLEEWLEGGGGGARFGGAQGALAPDLPPGHGDQEKDGPGVNPRGDRPATGVRRTGSHDHLHTPPRRSSPPPSHGASRRHRCGRGSHGPAARRRPPLRPGRPSRQPLRALR